MKKLFVILLACSLLLAAGVQAYMALQPRVEPSLNDSLSSMLPDHIRGWRVTDLPMAESVGMQERVEEILQYDDAIFRMYERGSTHIGVYIAYWKPGRVSISKAGTHTPDTCWVVAGWNQKDRRHSVEKSVDDLSLKPAEWGIYSKDGRDQHVIFWHLVGDTVYGYDQYGWDQNIFDKVKRHLLFLRDARTFGLNQRREQFFIRISSNRPIEEIWFDPAFEEIMRSIAELGIGDFSRDEGTES